MEGKRVQKPEPVAASCNGLLFWKTPGRMPGRRVLRPWKNFAVFRRFPRAETALEPRCGADLEAKRRIWNPETRCKRLQRALFGNPGPDAGKGIYVLGRISRDFDDFLRRGPPCGLGAEAAFKAKMGYETQKPAANGCNGSFFGKPRTDCRKGKSTSSEEFRGISTIFSEDTAVVGRIRANRPVRNTGLRQRRDKLCSGSRCFPGTVDKREESFYDK